MFERVPPSGAGGQDTGPVSISFTGTPPKPSSPLQDRLITFLATVLRIVCTDGLVRPHTFLTLQTSVRVDAVFNLKRRL